MWKSENSGKKTVELDAAPRPARRSIRREPLRPLAAPGQQERRGPFANVDFKSREWEIAFGVLGIVLFALAINAILFGVSTTIIK